MEHQCIICGEQISTNQMLCKSCTEKIRKGELKNPMVVLENLFDSVTSPDFLKIKE